MYVLTDMNNLVISIAKEIIRYPSKGIYVVDEDCLYTIELNVYTVDTIPEGVTPFRYYYTVDKGFYPFVPPEPEPEPKEPLEIIQEELAQVKADKNMLGMQLASLKISDFQKTQLINNLSAQIDDIKLEIIELEKTKGGET